MNGQYSRSAMILGENAIDILGMSHVAIFGIGGVGGGAVDALSRAGIGTLTLVDKDVVEESNINRQMVATFETIGRNKVEVAAEHILEINPECKLNLYNKFYLPDSADEIDLYDFDYILDCIDNVTGKMELIRRAKQADIPIISAMGAGNKLDPTAFEVSDIYNTSVCPLAKIIRKKCKEMSIDSLKVVYSKEEPKGMDASRTPGSVPFVPPVMGYIMAGECIKDLIYE